MGVQEQEHGRSQPAAVQEHLTCFIGQYNMGSRWTGAGGERSLACAVRRPGTEARKEQEQEGNKARLEQEQERGKSRSREGAGAEQQQSMHGAGEGAGAGAGAEVEQMQSRSIGGIGVG